MALGNSAQTSKNFKVRISAVTAMAAPHRRELYGSPENYISVWKYLIDVLHSLENTDADFVEYKYKDNLVEQVGRSLVLPSTTFKELYFFI